jgi:drug/metabolite transporter (DMT)-like permease
MSERPSGPGQPTPNVGRMGQFSPRALGMLALLTIIWGLTWPVMKIGASELPIFTFRAVAAYLSVMVTFSLARASGMSLSVPRGTRVPMVVSGLLYMGCVPFFTTLALTIIPSGHAAIIAFTMPLWTFLLSIPFLGERPTLMRCVGLALGMGGIGLLASRGAEMFVDAPLGVVAQLASAVSWAVAVIITKKTQWRMPMLVFTGWQCCIGGFPLAVGMAFDLPDLRSVSWLAIGATLYLGIISQGLGNWMWFRIVDMVPASVAGISALAIPAVGLLSGGLLLGEPVTVTEIVALLLVVGAVTTVLPLPGRRRRPSEDRAP